MGRVAIMPVLMPMPRLSRYWFTAFSIAPPSSCLSNR